MIVIAPDVMCVSVPQPKAWKMDGREGITYKVDLSDGEETVQIACETIDVYSKFVPFKRYDVSLSLVQTNFEGRKGVKCMVVQAALNEE